MSVILCLALDIVYNLKFDTLKVKRLESQNYI